MTVPAWEAHRGSAQLRNGTSKAPPIPPRERIAREGDGAPRGAGRREPLSSRLLGEEELRGQRKAPAAGGEANAGLGPWSPRASPFPSRQRRTFPLRGAATSPSPGGAPCRGRLPPEGPQPSRGPAPALAATHSLVSRVMMMRMGLLFIPPTQLLLHMKLYRMVVNSVPTCPGGESRR